MIKIWFEGYGFLDYLEPKEYFADAWAYVETSEGDDGKRYDIVELNNEFRFTNI